MRSKRRQRRWARVRATAQAHEERPDPFSANNGALVDLEEERAGWCPCCAERFWDRWYARYARALGHDA